MHTLFLEFGSDEFIQEKRCFNLVKDKENFDLVREAKEIDVGLVSVQGDETFNLINLDFFRIEKFFDGRNLCSCM